MKLEKIIKSALYEEVAENLNLYYNTDIFMRRTEIQKDAQQADVEAEEEPAEEEPAEEPEEEQPEESVAYRNSMLNEETFRTKTSGMLKVEDDEARTIKSLDDLLAYINRQVGENGSPIINDLIVEVTRALVDKVGVDEMKKLVYKGDKINAVIDYGPARDDSVGFEITKNIGVDDVSISLRMDGKIQQSFNENVFNQKLIIFINELK